MDTFSNLDAQKAGLLSSTLSSSSSPTSDPFYAAAAAAADDQSLPPLPSFYDQNLAATFTVPSDISHWDGSVDLDGATDSPGSLYSEQALAPPPGAVKQDMDILGQYAQHDISPSSLSFLQASSPSYHQAVRAFSPHVFHQRPPTTTLTPPRSNGASNNSSSASPSPASAASRMHTFAVAPQQPSSAHPALSITTNASRVTDKTEPDDAPWNLVQSNAPWKMRGATGSSVANGSSSGPVPSVMETNGMFMRSPTPTKRQRTNQACEKCRDRKAKCNGGRPTCARCASRGLVCEYAKQRRMRGPNRGANNGGSEHQRTSSSPAINGPPSVSIHISNGMSGPQSHTGRVETPPVASGPYHLKSVRSGIARATQPSPLTLDIPLPTHRHIHVAQSFPDLHAEATRASDTSSTSSSPISVVSFPHSADAYSSRPRSHTTPYPLPTTAIPAQVQYQLQQRNGHLGHLYHGFRSGGGAHSDASPSEPSEPPSATSSGFSADLYGYPLSLPPPSYPTPVAMPMTSHAGHSPASNGGVNYGHDKSMAYRRSNVGFRTGNGPRGDSGSGRGSEDTIHQDEGADTMGDHRVAHVALDGFESGEQSWRDAPVGWDGGNVVPHVEKVYGSGLGQPGSAPASLSSSVSPMSYGYGSQLSLPLATWDHTALSALHDLNTVQMPHLELSRMTVNPQSAAPNNYLWVSGEAGLRSSGHTLTFQNQAHGMDSTDSLTDSDFKAWFADSPEMTYGHHNDHKPSSTALDVAAANDTTRNIDVYEVLNQS